MCHPVLHVLHYLCINMYQVLHETEKIPQFQARKCTPWKLQYCTYVTQNGTELVFFKFEYDYD